MSLRLRGFIPEPELTDAIPANLYYERANPLLNIEASPFYINAEMVPLPTSPEPICVGVSAFGVEGTNVHMILERAPKLSRVNPQETCHIVIISAKTEERLSVSTDRLIKCFAESPFMEVSDVSLTLRTGRAQYSWRRYCVCDSLDDARESLLHRNSGTIWTREVSGGAPRVVVLLPEVALDDALAALQSYLFQPVYRRAIEACIAEMAEPDRAEIDTLLTAHDRHIAISGTASAALKFMCQYATAELLKHLGLAPVGVIGRGIGLYVAATIANVLPLPRSLNLAIVFGADRPTPDLFHSGVEADPTSASAAGHSLQQPLHEPDMKIWSTACNRWLTRQEALDPNTWSLRSVMNESQARGDLCRVWGDELIITLSGGCMTPANVKAAALNDCPFPDAVAPAASPRRSFLQTLGALWLSGVPIKWKNLDEGSAYHKVRVPGYAFDRRRYWHTPGGIDSSPELAPSSSYLRSAFATEASECASSDALNRTVESALCDLFQTVLGCQRVMPSDDFFTLGGDSLGAMRLLAHIRSRFALDLTIEAIFAAPSVRALSKAILCQLSALMDDRGD